MWQLVYSSCPFFPSKCDPNLLLQTLKLIRTRRSPYWLVAHGKADKARDNIAKLHRPDYDVDGHMAQVHDALARMNADDETQGSVWECFHSKNIKRTIVSAFIFFIQNSTGSVWVIGYMSYFMQLGGMSAARSFDTTVGISGLMTVGNICGWYFIEKFGRRGTALYGTGLLACTLLLIGVLAVIQEKGSQGALWGQGKSTCSIFMGNILTLYLVAFMAIWAFTYQGTIGSAAWVISSENATSRLRSPTQSLVTITSGLSSCIWSFALPYAINPDQGNLGGKIAFIFGAVMVLSFIFIWVMVPETGGRTFNEIDELYKRGVPAWKWSQTKVETVVEETKGHEDFN
jgi:hypothetical protein